MDFNAEEYWGKREFKVWVVKLHTTTRINRKRVPSVETKYVRARTEERAIKTARANSMTKGRVYATARLATPTDLGCVPTPNTQAAAA